MTMTRLAEIADQWGDVLEVDEQADTLFLEVRDESPEEDDDSPRENTVGLSVDAARELRDAINAFLTKRTPAESSSS